MPRPSPDGMHVAHGVGGGWASLDNKAFARGGVFGWPDADRICFANGDDEWFVSIYRVSTGEIVRAQFTMQIASADAVVRGLHLQLRPPVDRGFSRSFRRSPYQLPTYDQSGGDVRRTLQKTGRRRTLALSANFGFSGGGHYAIWFGTVNPAETGLWSSTGFRRPAAGLLNMGPDGAIAYKPEYQSNGPTHVHELNGDDWKIADGSPEYVSMHPSRQLLMTIGMRATPINLPQPLQAPGAMWKAEAAFAGGEWWMAPYYDKHGIAIHRFAALDGYPHLPKGDGWHAMIAIDANILRVYTAVGEGEAPGQIWVRDYDVTKNLVRDPWGANVWTPITRVAVIEINAGDIHIKPVCGIVYLEGEEGICPVCENYKALHQHKKVTTMHYRDGSEIEPYLNQRWNELGIPAKTKALADQIRGVEHREPGAQDEERFKAIQIPAFVQIVGELHHVKKMADVGLSTKNGGNHWTLPDGRNIATDIIALRALDDAGTIVESEPHGNVDALFSGGSADTRPTFNFQGKNEDSSRPWMEPPTPGGVIVDPGTGDTHRYDGGGHDTNECDICHKSRFDAVHKIPLSKIRHQYDGGEQDTGLCDICQLPPTADIHQDAPVVDPGDGGTVDKHEFVGTGKFCSECGKAKTDPIHQIVVEPGVGNLAETNAKLDQMIAELKLLTSKTEITNQKLDALRVDTVAAIKDFAKAIDVGGILNILKKK